MFDESERSTLRKAASIKRKARQKAKADRPANPKKTRGRVRNNAYLAWLRRQWCCVCGTSPPCDPAHIRMHKPGELPTGLARKPDDTRCVSLCRACHDRQHSMNEALFWGILGKDPFMEASVAYSRFLSQGDSK